MNDRPPEPSVQSPKPAPVKSAGSPRTSTLLPLAISLGEALLLAALAFALAEYWLMLPVGLRSIAAFGLAGLALLILLRLIRFYARRRQSEPRPTASKFSSPTKEPAD